MLSMSFSFEERFFVALNEMASQLSHQSTHLFVVIFVIINCKTCSHPHLNGCLCVEKGRRKKCAPLESSGFVLCWFPHWLLTSAKKWSRLRESGKHYFKADTRVPATFDSINRTRGAFFNVFIYLFTPFDWGFSSDGGLAELVLPHLTAHSETLKTLVDNAGLLSAALHKR